MAQAPRDENRIPTLLGVSSADGTTPVVLWADPTTHRLLVDLPSGTGDVVGPASSTDNAVVRFNSTTGKLIQNSAVIIDDSNNVTGVGNLTIAGDLIHTGDTNNLIAFTTDTQTFKTGGSSRMDITDSGVRLGAANARVTTVLDQDDMSSDSATALSTQQSIKAYVDSQVATSDTLQEVFDNGQTITIANTDNQTLALTQNDTTNNPNAMNITNTGSGLGMFLDNTGGGRGLVVFTSNTGAFSADIRQNNSSNTSGSLFVANAGTGNAITIDQNGDTGTSALSGALVIDNTGNNDRALSIFSNNSTTSQPLVWIEQDHASADEEALYIQNDGTGNAITIDQNGNVGTSVTTDGALHIENTGNTGIGLGVYSNIGSTSAADLVSIRADNTAFDQVVLRVRNDGTNSAVIVQQVAANSNFAISTDINADARGIGVDKDVTNANSGRESFELINTSVVTDAGTYTKTGSIVKLTSEVTETSGTITDSAIVLDINQTHADATGNVVDIANSGTGIGLKIAESANGVGLEVDSAATSQRGAYIHRNVESSADGLLTVFSDNGSDTGNVLFTRNDGTGNGIFLDQNGNGVALKIDSEATTAQIIQVDAISTSVGNGAFRFTTSGIYTGTLSSSFINFGFSNSSSTGNIINIDNVGTGKAIEIDQNGNGTAFSIDSEATTAPAIIADIVDGDAHLRLVGDSGNGSPTEGDFWRESDGLKYYNGTTEVNLLVGTYELDMGANSIGFTMQTATGDGTTTIDWGLGNHFDFTFGAQNDTFTFTAPAKPGVYTMSLKQDSTGSRTATWPASVKWPGGSAPTLTTTATTGYDTIGFRYDGTNYYGIATLNFS